MKKLSFLIPLFFIAMLLQAQDQKQNVASFDMGNGINFSFNNGDYHFKIGGFIQPSYKYEKTEGMDAQNEFNSKRSYFSISGEALKEKISFLIQTDYSLNSPLLDAWIAYHPFSFVSISVGQKQTFLNNREMMFNESMLQFTERSSLSTSFSQTGREFGAFVEFKFREKIGISPKFAITSGDGRNSFGADSRDVDLGGIKYGGRLDVFPLGYFSKGNDLTSADIIHEKSPKIAAGIAFSRNNGASNSTGEGHGDFFLYNSSGNIALPDYAQVYADFLLKYHGFSLLAEFADASAKDLKGAFIEPTGNTLLAPQQISEYLVLGEGYNVQLGYVTKKGLSFDARFDHTTPEFQANQSSLLSELDSFTLGISKYFFRNNLKIQSSVSKLDYSKGNSQTTGELLVQIVF